MGLSLSCRLSTVYAVSNLYSLPFLLSFSLFINVPQGRYRLDSQFKPLPRPLLPRCVRPGVLRSVEGLPWNLMPCAYTGAAPPALSRAQTTQDLVELLLDSHERLLDSDQEFLDSRERLLNFAQEFLDSRESHERLLDFAQELLGS